MKFDWERLYRVADFTSAICSDRAKVPGGWIVKSSNWMKAEDKSETCAVTSVFICDPTHQWKVDPECLDEQY